nr:immunoglobulin heavy chain junction region [Macaca mulatta]
CARAYSFWSGPPDFW